MKRRKVRGTGESCKAEVDWEVFLQSDATVDALIDFIEERTNCFEMRKACRPVDCKQQCDRIRTLGNYTCRKKARSFLRQHYTW